MSYWRSVAVVVAGPVVGVAVGVAVGRTVSGSATHPPYNPQVTQATIDRTICVSGWTDTVRPPTTFTNPIKSSLIALLPATADTISADYELDHVIPLALGGAPADPRNLVLELWPEARHKDTLERAVQVAVCGHNLTLAQGRAVFGSWKNAP